MRKNNSELCNKQKYKIVTLKLNIAESRVVSKKSTKQTKDTTKSSNCKPGCICSILKKYINEYK